MWAWVLLCFLLLPIVAFLILFFANTEDDNNEVTTLSESQKENLRNALYNKVTQDQHIANYNYVIKTFGGAYNSHEEEVNTNHKLYRGRIEWEYHTVYKLSRYGSIYFPSDFPRYLIKTTVDSNYSYKVENAKKYMSEFNDLVLTLKKHEDIIKACRKYGFYLDISKLLKSNN